MNYKKERSICLIIWLIIIFFVAAAAMAEEKSLSKEEVAVVNGVEIKLADFDSEFNAIKKRIASQGKPVGETQLAKIKERIIESLIEQELLFQESQKQKIKVQQSKIDESLADIKKKFKNEADFTKVLTEKNISVKDLLSKIERNLAIRELIHTNVSLKINISEKKSKEFYNTHPDYFKLPEQVKASHILIKIDSEADTSTRTEAKNKIEKIQKQLKKGEDFASLAKKYSEGPSNTKGGELGYFKRGQMVKPFEVAAFALKPAETSDIVETRFGLHLIHVTDKKAEKTVDYEDVKQKIVQHLKQEKEKKEIPLYIQGIRKKATIEKLL